MEQNIIYREIGKDTMYRIWHASEEVMLIYTYSDGGSIVCSEKAYPIEKGVLCLIGAKKYHYTLPADAEKYDRSKIFLTAKHFDKIASILPESAKHRLSSNSFIYAKIPEEEQAMVDDIFRRTANYQSTPTYAEWMRIGCIVELLTYLCRYSLESTPAPSGTISRAIEYINKNLSDTITIDDICSEVHMSKYHFCRRFRNAVGTTVMDYILRTRIMMAKDMLDNENMTVTEISNKCGFSSLSYFSRVFKEKTGKTPVEYRKLY